MVSIQSWLQDNASKLRSAGIQTNRLDCMVIAEDTLQKSREWLLAHSEEKISPNLQLKLDKKIARRLNHIPVAYIIEHKQFYGRKFIVNKHVLIPRPESEEIIELFLGIDKKSFNTVFDIGTGSGCLAITAKLEIPDAEVFAVDSSKNALSVASENAKKLKSEINFQKSNLLKSVDLVDNSVLLVNLPYVPDSLISSEEIKREPANAIFSGPDGLDHYREFWRQLATFSNKNIRVILECLENQQNQIVSYASRSGYRQIKTSSLAMLFEKV